MYESDGRAELCAEIASFYSGFGQAEALRSAVRSAALLVAISDDDRVLLTRLGGVAWVCTFTSEVEYARYLDAKGVDPIEGRRYHTVFGRRIFDWLACRADEPTGLMVDICGDQPMMFPPETGSADVAS